MRQVFTAWFFCYQHIFKMLIISLGKVLVSICQALLVSKLLLPLSCLPYL
jgi:hypothetical protein